MKTARSLCITMLVLSILVVSVAAQEPTATPAYSIWLPLIMDGSGMSQPTPTATVTPEPTATPTATPRPSGTVEVVSSSAYWSWSTLKVVGEVINNSSDNAEWIAVTGILRDADGSVLRVEDAYVMTEVLEPGHKAPFMVYFFDEPRYTSYDLTVNFDRTEDPAPNLEVLSTAVTGDLYIVGEVRNNHAWKTYTWVRAAATLYDVAGTVINCGYNTTSPDDLSAGEVGYYSVWFWDGPTAWTSYAVIAYGWDW